MSVVANRPRHSLSQNEVRFLSSGRIVGNSEITFQATWGASSLRRRVGFEIPHL
jgi:hypothetical protein